MCYEEDNIIKGYIYLKPVNNDSQNCYLIDGLYVDNEYRNKGIATKLIENALNVIKETNAAVVDINVMANNSVAISLYKRFGFNEFRISLRKNI